MLRQMVALFVYGTLKTGHAAHGLVADRVRSVLSARCRGSLYALAAGYPALVEDGPGWVFGEILELADPAPWLELDAYEGCDPVSPATSLYHRVERPMAVAAGMRRAWCYVMPPDRPPLRPGAGARFIPEGCWEAAG